MRTTTEHEKELTILIYGLGSPFRLVITCPESTKESALNRALQKAIEGECTKKMTQVWSAEQMHEFMDKTCKSLKSEFGKLRWCLMEYDMVIWINP